MNIPPAAEAAVAMGVALISIPILLYGCHYTLNGLRRISSLFDRRKRSIPVKHERRKR